MTTQVVIHELAHQWFGNLVTMEWWDDLWLNEGFATWMETGICDRLHPEWSMWEQFIQDMQVRASSRRERRGRAGFVVRVRSWGCPSRVSRRTRREAALFRVEVEVVGFLRFFVSRFGSHPPGGEAREACLASSCFFLASLFGPCPRGDASVGTDAAGRPARNATTVVSRASPP